MWQTCCRVSKPLPDNPYVIAYPEIINEFKMILENYLQHESAPSFKSRANRALKQMKP
jgi:hypothetical protein